MRVYVPSNFNFEEFEQKHNPTARIRGYKRDKVAYLFYQLIYIPMFNAKYQLQGVFIPLNSVILKQRIGSNYKDYMELLIPEYIETDNHYIEGQKSKAFRISQPYALNITEYELTDFSLIHNLSVFYWKRNKISIQDKYLTKWLTGLTIDRIAAFDYIAEDCRIKTEFHELRDFDTKENRYKDPNLQYNLSSICIDKIAARSFEDAHTDTEGYRFHSLLTSTRKALRYTLTYEKKSLINFDIKNSQPYFSSLILTKTFWEKEANQTIFKKLCREILQNTRKKDNNIPSIMFTRIAVLLDSKDVQLYIALVQKGTFYEYFMDEIKKRTGIVYTRDVIKREMFKVFFSNNYTQNDFKNIFKAIFPSVHEIFSLIKKGKHNKLALLLQRIESEILLRDICKQITLKHPDVPIFTIHDSIATTIDNQAIVLDIMKQRFSERMNSVPIIEPELWNKNYLKTELEKLHHLQYELLNAQESRLTA